VPGSTSMPMSRPVSNWTPDVRARNSGDRPEAPGRSRLASVGIARQDPPRRSLSVSVVPAGRRARRCRSADRG
jgi:hypothetical protein